jgi:hypothetical protein
MGRTPHDGVLQHLVRRVLGAADGDIDFHPQPCKSLSLPTKPGRFEGARLGLKGFGRKAFTAMLQALSDRRALIFVVDADGERDVRERDIRQGFERARAVLKAASVCVASRRK